MRCFYLYNGLSYLGVADRGEAGEHCDDVAAVFNALVHIIETTADYEQMSKERYELFGVPAFEDRKWQSWRKVFGTSMVFVVCGSCRSMHLH